ncbi:hypothetical protein LL912_13720 [Niabella sp. CC-SYL272]|uniref:hypothetical protein n=1 Tax=Niabella agricola TaxID=2891571 RepID=UPI001F362E4F|nr:hypothetical protein [Niabella agricola]MCF3109833.1 hypothetical protein [Niabella agricola]
MKKTITTLVMGIIVLTISCKKNEISSVPKEESKQEELVRVEKDYLAFKDYETFFGFLVAVSSFDGSEYIRKLENTTSFKSLYSYARDFDAQLDIVDSLKDASMFYKVKKDFSDIIIWNGDSSYSYNAQSPSEAKLINRKGIVKVGSDFLIYNLKGHAKYNNISYDDLSRYLNSNKTLPRAIGPNTAPPPNGYTVSSFEKKTDSEGSNKRRMSTKLNLFSINTNTYGNRGFLSIVYHAEHKNWLGVFRTVPSAIASASGPLSVSFSDGTSQGVDFGIGAPGGSQSTFLNIIDPGSELADGVREGVILVSKTLKDNINTISHPVFGNLGANKGYISRTVKLIDDDLIAQQGAYWTLLNTYSFGLFGYSSGEGLFPTYYVNYTIWF